MVARPELVGLPERPHVVVEAAVLQADALARVDVPDVHARDDLSRCGRGEHVVERAAEPAEHVAVLVRLRRAEVDVAGGPEHLDRVLLAVGVEVAQQEHLVGAGRGLTLGGEGDQGVRLVDARAVRPALAVPWSASGPVPPPFDLKWFAIATKVDPASPPTGRNAWTGAAGRC